MSATNSGYIRTVEWRNQLKPVRFASVQLHWAHQASSIHHQKRVRFYSPWCHIRNQVLPSLIDARELSSGKKLRFKTKSVGHMLTLEGLAPDPQKFQVILGMARTNWQARCPTSPDVGRTYLFNFLKSLSTMHWQIEGGLEGLAPPKDYPGKVLQIDYRCCK